MNNKRKRQEEYIEPIDFNPSLYPSSSSSSKRYNTSTTMSRRKKKGSENGSSSKVSLSIFAVFEFRYRDFNCQFQISFR